MASFRVLSFLTRNAGTPATGLSAVVVDAWRLDTGAQVLTAQAMTEVAGGFYQYEWSGYDRDVQYAFRIDAGTAAVDARYVPLTNDNFLADAEEGVPPATMAQVIESTITLQQSLRVVLSALAADAIVPDADGNFSYRDQADSKNRITGTVDESGNRTITGLDLS